jgi:hypothetical protein
MLGDDYANTLDIKDMQAIATTLNISAPPPFVFSKATVSPS